MFDILSNLTKAAVGAALTPVAVLADIVTLPASAYNGTETWEATEKRLNQISESVDKALK
jgi:hypothetical protein